MRLLTRSDFDGLACAVLLKDAGVIDHYSFVHPKDLQDGLVEVTADDCLANVPYVPGCGLWFDHHSSEVERDAHKGEYAGDSRPCDSAAHVVYDYYGGAERFPHFSDMLAAVDKVDAAKLSREEILNPTGWVLLGFIMDPRTGLGRFRDFTISNYTLMERMIDWCASLKVEEILALPDLVERIELYAAHTKQFTEMLKSATRVRGRLIVTDLRGAETIYAGNRFVIYALYPEQDISAWIVSGRGGRGCSVAVGHSVLKRTSRVDVGALMLKYGGGGHRQVGTCQFSGDKMEERVSALLGELEAASAE